MPGMATSLIFVAQFMAEPWSDMLVCKLTQFVPVSDPCFLLPAAPRHSAVFHEEYKAEASMAQGHLNQHSALHKVLQSALIFVEVRSGSSVSKHCFVNHEPAKIHDELSFVSLFVPILISGTNSI